jgi:hypothetical protein
LDKCYWEVNFLVKINPGSNVQKNNETRTASAGSENLFIPEPNMLAVGVFQCPVCHETFKSRDDYDSHVLARHQTITEAGALRK